MILLLACFVILGIAAGCMLIRWKLAFGYLKSYGIQGPTPELYFGNSRQISEMMGPLKFIEVNFSKYGHVFGYYVGIRPNIVVKNLEMLKQIMGKQFNCFVDRDEIIFPTMIQRNTSIRAGGLFASKGDQWKRQRKIISKSFNSTNLRKMSPVVEKSCDSLITKFGEFSNSGESFDISEVFGRYTMEVILATGFGHKVDLINGNTDELTKASESVFEAMRKGNAEPIVALLSNFPFLWSVLRAIAMRTQNAASYALFEDKIAELVEKRLEDIRQNEEIHYDLLQMLIEAKADSDDEDEQSAIKNKNTLSDIEVASIATSFLLAGHETARSTLAFIFYLLAVNPTVQEKLFKEIDQFYSRNPGSTLFEVAQSVEYVDMVVQESLRMYPAAPIAARKTAKNVEINGQIFPKGCAVVLPIMAIHYSPEHWSEPTLFRPERFSKEEKEERHPLAHMPFGYGPRSCIGMKLALMETKMALTALIREYKFLEGPDTEKPLKTSLGVTLSPTNGVYLVLENR